ncbi:filamentous hemagglutinin family outer membrane protein [Desulfatibacillum aliphaticivorans]|uniref:Filamentous hemagglutinin family outer membrane protein n=1 Tax=Desulfatibacillum aliphaticivorans TaxID=218208 RepID=B8FIJ9_DESAL|nr:filamentous hemagglutinin N-terminal domain-containing protein [Desulfatibacillum aliphaticivorans]ACL03989.1 filamentous hemagglutinin family outer membrane protein [Desulfatibacillum aliphaticivorans]
MASLSRKIKRARMRKERFTAAGGAGYRSLDRSLLRARRLGIGLGGTLVMVSAAPALAGQGFTVNVDGNTTTYNQTDQNVYNRVESYNIAADETHRYNQPNSDAIFVQRVVGQDPSSILGNLIANGQVWVMNPSGVLIGADATVNTAGFMATSLVMEEDDFFAGNYTFKQDGDGGYVVNRGTIIVQNGGYAVLAGASVVNTGVIQADLGSVVLASGTQATVDFDGDGLINFALGDGQAAQVTGPDGEALTTAVLNAGQVRANGGRVLMTAQAAGNILDSVVNNQGVIEANSVVERNGEIILLGGDEGLVVNEGTLNVDGDDAGESAGSVYASGDKVYENGTISANAGAGGDAGQVTLTSTTLTLAGAESTITANGAGANSNGGDVILWSDGDTWFKGEIQANGGDVSGDGGFVEVSGVNNLAFRGDVQASAVDGNAGTLLLDPTNIYIIDGSGGGRDAELGDGQILAGSGTGTWTISETGLEGIAGNVDIVLEATNNITVENLSDDTLSLNTTGAKSLTMTADADNDGGGAITFIGAASDTVVTQGGDMNFNAGDGMVLASLDTNGGDVTANMNNAGTGVANLDLNDITTDGGDVNVTNAHGVAGTAVGNLLVRGDIATSGGSVNLSATNDLTQIEGATIVTGGGDVTMAADSDGDTNGVLTIAGKLGVDNIDTRGALSDGDLDVSAAQFGMNAGSIQLGAGTMTILSSSQGTIGVGSGAGDLNVGGNDLQRINADTIVIGSLAGGAVDVDSTADLSGQDIEVYSNANITVGDIRLGATGVATLQSQSGAVVDDGGIGGGGTYIQAGSLNITANSVGGDGTANAALDIDIASGANVVNVTANTGGIYLRDVGAGNVALTNFNLTATGSGQNVSITAASGSILANSAAFDTNIGDDNIYLTTENAGSAKNIVFSALLDVSVDSGNVYLTATGDVRDSGALTLLKANYLEIDATNGVGSSGTGTGSPFNVNVNSLQAKSENAIYIREDDDVTVEGLETTANTAEIQLVAGGSIVLNGDVDADNSGDVTLDAITGAITRTSGTIYGGLLTISAADGIGATGATGLAIHTDVATLVADNSNTGDIVILEANNLTVGGSTAAQTVTNNSGDIIITSGSGSLNVVQDVTAGSGGDGGVVLTTATNAQTVTIGTGVTVEGGAGGIGGVTIQSDSITLNTGVTLIANGGTGYDKGGDVKLYPTNSNLAITLNGAGNVNFVTTPALTNLADFITVNDDGFLVIGDEAHSGNVTVAGTAAATFGSGTNVAVLTNKTVNLNLGASGDISTTGDVYIYAGQQIVDGGNDGSADILADNVYLNAGSGIGTGASANSAVDIVATDVYATNSTSNGIYLNILGGTGVLGSGAVNVQEAHANAAGQVWIQSTAAGGLTLTDVDTENGAITVDENTGAVTIVAVDGNTVAGANTVSIEGQGNVSLAGTANSHVYSAGNVDITSVQGNIVSGANTGVEVQGTNATLTAFASIGAALNDLRTQVADLDASAGNGDIRVVEADGLNLSDVDTQTGGIYITSITGNISIDDVESDVNVAGSADINIVATSGSVIFNAGGTLVGDDYVIIRAGLDIVSDGATGVNNEITAPLLALDVKGNIGGSGVNVLEVDADNLELLIRNDINGGSSNSAYIVDSDDLTLGGVIGGIMTGVVATAVGDVTIDISAAGSLAVVNDVNGVKADATSGDATINLTAGTDLSAADTILATTTGTGSFDASVTLTAGDNLTTTAAGTVTADVNGGSNSGNATVTIDGNGTGVDRVVVGGNVTTDAALGNAIIDISARGNGAGGPGTAALRVAGDLSAATSGMANAGVQIGVTTAGGSAYIDGDIDVSSLGVNGTDSVLIQTTQGHINLLGDITGSSTTSGNVTLNTQGGGAADINLSGAISLTGSGTGSYVEVLAGQNVGFTGSADIDLNGGASSYVRVDAAAGAITMANGARINAGSSGSIDLNANGNITIGQLITGLGGATVVTIDSTTGGVIDGGGSGGDDIIANEVGAITEINAATSIGATGGGEIETQIDTLYASGSVVAIIETDDIILGDTQAVAAPGAGIIRADGGTGTVVDITAQGDIYAYNINAKGGANQGDISIVSNTGNIIVGAIAAGSGTNGDVTIIAKGAGVTAAVGGNIKDDGDGTGTAYTQISAGNNITLTAGTGAAVGNGQYIGSSAYLDITADPDDIWKAVDVNEGSNAVPASGTLTLNSKGNIQIYRDSSMSALSAVPVSGGAAGDQILVGANGSITVSNNLNAGSDNLSLIALDGNLTINASKTVQAAGGIASVELYAAGTGNDVIFLGSGATSSRVVAASTVTVTAESGAILGAGASHPSGTVTAGTTAFLSADSGIGQAGTAKLRVDVNATTIDAVSDTGGIYLQDVGADGVTITATAATSGDIDIIGSSEDVTLGNVTATSGNINVIITGAANDVTVEGTVQTVDTVGDANDVTITAGQNLLFGAAGAVVSDDDAFLTGTAGNIRADSANAGIVVTADYAYLVAQNSIDGGSVNLALNTSLNSLEAQFGTDNANTDHMTLYNNQALTVGGASGAGIFIGSSAGAYSGVIAALSLGANGTITINESIDVRNQRNTGSTDVKVYTDSGNILINAGATDTSIAVQQAGGVANLEVAAAGSVILTALGSKNASIQLDGNDYKGTSANLTVTAGSGDIIVDANAGGGDAWIALEAGNGSGSSAVANMTLTAGGDIEVLGGAAATGVARIYTATYGAKAETDVSLNADNIRVWDETGSAEISSTVSGAASSTIDMALTATGAVDVDGGSVSATVAAKGASASNTGAHIVIDAASVTVDNSGDIAVSGGAGFKDIIDITAAGAVTVDTGGSINAASKTGSVTIDAGAVTIGSAGSGSVQASGSVKALVTINASTGDIRVGYTGGTGVVKAVSSGSIATVALDADEEVYVGYGTGATGSILATSAATGTATINISAGSDLVLGEGSTATTLVQASGNKAVITLDSDTGYIDVGYSGAVGDVKAVGVATGSITATADDEIYIGDEGDGLVQASGVKATVLLDAGSEVYIGSSGIGSVLATATGSLGSIDITAGDGVELAFTGGTALVSAAASNATGSAKVSIDGEYIALTEADGTGTGAATVQAAAKTASVTFTASDYTGSSATGSDWVGIYVGSGDTVKAVGAATGASTVWLDSNDGSGEADVIIDGLVQAGNNAGAATVNIDSTDAVSLDNSGSILAYAGGSNQGSIDIAANGDVDLYGTVTARSTSGNAYVNVDSVTGDIAAGSSGTGITADAGSGGGDEADINLWAHAGSVSIDGPIEAIGTEAYVDIDAALDVTLVDGLGSLRADGSAIGSINIEAGGNVTISEDVYADGNDADVYIRADGATGITINNTLETGVRAISAGGRADIVLDTKADVDVDGGVYIYDIVLAQGTAGAKVDIDSDAAVTMSATGSIQATTTNGTGSIYIDANGNVTLDNDVKAISTNDDANVFVTAADITVNTTAGGVLADAGSLAADIARVYLDAAGNIVVNQDVQATGYDAYVTMEADGATGVTINAGGANGVTATGVRLAVVWLDADDNAGAAGNVTVSNSVEAHGGLGGTSYVDIDADGNVILNNTGGGIQVTGSGAKVDVDADGNVELHNDIDATGTTSAKVQVDAGGATGISLDSGKHINVTGSGGAAYVTLDTSNSSSMVDINGTITVTSPWASYVQIGRTGDAVAGGIAVDGAINVTGSHTSATEALLFADGAIDINAQINVTDSVGDATIIVDAGTSVTTDLAGNLTAQAGTAATATARVSIVASAGVTVDTQILADAATNTGKNAYVNIGTGGARITGAISLQSNADIYADGGTGLAAVNIFSTGNITAHGAVDIQADSDTKNGTDATVAINSSLGGVSIGSGIGTILADGDDNATVTITGGGAGANRVLVSQNVTADAASGNATLTVSAAGTGGRATDDALVVSGALSALADEGDAMVTLTSSGDATVQAAIVATGKDSVAGGDGARSADIIITVAKGLETTAGGTLTATAAEETGGSNFGPARVRITANGATNADQVRIGGAIDAVSERGQSLIDISSQGVGYVGNGVPAMYITGDLTTESKAGAGWSRIILDSQGAAGSVVITGDLSADSAGSTGYIDLTSNTGAFQIDGSITGSFAATGIVSIDTQGGATTDIDLNNAISLTAGNFISSYVELLAGRTVDMNNTAADITAVGACEVAITADTQAGDNGGQIIMANGTVVNAGSGIIDLDADGNITLGQLITTNNAASAVNISSVHGALVNGGDAGGEDIIATGAAAVVTITTEDGIGAPGNPIETDITTLIASVTGTGGIYIDENDGITLTNVDTVKGDIVITAGNTAAGNVTATDVAVTTSGDISITNNLTGDILVGVIQTADGDIALTANSGAINEIGAGDVGVDIITANGLLDMWASGGIGTAAGGLETTVNTLYSTGSSVIINETDDIILGDEQDVAIAGSGKVMATNATGSIDIEAGGDIYANYVVAATGTATTVSIDSNGGSITLGDVSGYDVTINANKNVLDDGDGGSAAAPSVIPFYTQVVAGHDLTINAGSAGSGYYIGTNTPIDPRTGSIFLAVDAKWANVGSFTSTDNIQIYQTGDVTIAAAPNFNSGGGADDQILHMAEDNYTVNAGFVVAGNDNIWLAALNGDLTIAAGQTVQASSGSVDLFARNGDVILAGAIAATGNAQVEATGRILDRGAGAGTGDAVADITVASGVVTLKAGSGIGTGSSAASAIDVIACTIDATNTTSNGVFINSLGGTAANAGSVEIRTAYAQTAGNVWINGQTDLYLTDVQAADDVDVTTGGDAGDDIFVEYVQAGGAIGDDITLTATSGSILEVTADATVDIVSAGGLLTMTAANNIGGVGEADIETTVAGINASSTTSGVIYITESDGVTLTDVDTASGDVVIVAGATGSGLMIAADVIAGVAGDVTLTNSSGGILLGSVQAVGDRVTLDASTFISDGANAVPYDDVIADELVMTAGTTIGVVGGLGGLDVTVNNLEAYAGDTGVAGPTAVVLANSGSLTIGGITPGMNGVQAVSTNNTGAKTAAATINITANSGGIAVNELVQAVGTAADISLIAGSGAINTAAAGDVKGSATTTVDILMQATGGGISTLGIIDANAGNSADVNLITNNTGNISVGAEITADGPNLAEIEITTNDAAGSVVIDDNVLATATAGDATIEINAGSGGVTANTGGGSGIYAQASDSVIPAAATTGGNAQVTIDAANGNIILHDSVGAKGYVNATADITATGVGSIQTDRDVLAAAITGNATLGMDVQNSAITIFDKGGSYGVGATSKSGASTVNILANTGNITIDNKVFAGSDGTVIGFGPGTNSTITIETDSGAILLETAGTGTGEVYAYAGTDATITLDATNGGITSAGVIEATGAVGTAIIDVLAKTTGNIDVNAGGTITAKAGTNADIELNADNGGVEVSAAILGSGAKALVTLEANGVHDIATTGAGTVKAKGTGPGSAAVINILAGSARDVSLDAAVAATGGETALVNVEAAANVTTTANGTINSKGTVNGRVLISSLAGTAGNIGIGGAIYAEGAGAGGFQIDIQSHSGNVTLDGAVTGNGGTSGVINVLAENAGGSSIVTLNNLVSFRATGGTIDVTAEDDVLFSNVLADIIATGAPVVTITADADGAVPGSGGAITMVDGAGIDAGAGTITLQADESITLGQLVTTNATTAAVSITSDNGALLDGGDNPYTLGGATEDIIADASGARATINVVTGAGTLANPIETDVNELVVNNTAGSAIGVANDIVIAETDNINIFGINQDTTGSSHVQVVTTNGTITVLEAGSGIDTLATAGSKGVYLDANGVGQDVIVNQSIDTDGAGVIIDAGHAANFGVKGDVTTNGGDVVITSDIDAAAVGSITTGGITMSDDLKDAALIDAGSGTITLEAKGDIRISGLLTSNNTTGAVRVTSTQMGIVDNGDVFTDIVATGANGWVNLTAVDLIGRVVNDDVIVDPGSGSYDGRDVTGALKTDPDPVGNAIDTQMQNLKVVTSAAGAEIAIDNTGYDLVLGTTANTVVPSAGVDASMWVRNDLNLTVDAWTLDGNDNVGLISTLQNVTFPDVGALAGIFNGGTGANFAFTGSRVADIAVGTGTVRLEAVNGIVQDSASGAITIQAEDLILKSKSLYSEDITNTVRFATANYDYATGVDQYSPFGATNKVSFNVVAEVTNLDVEITGSGESFHFAQANDSDPLHLGDAVDLTIRDLDGDGYSMLINGHNTTPDADILVYVGNGVDINTDGVTLTIYDDLSAQNGNISLWVDSNNTQDDGGVIIGASASVTTDATADQKGALYIIGDNTIETNANVYANSGEVIVLHATANHIIIDDATVGAGTVTLDTGGNVWDIRFTQNGSLTVNGGNLNIQNADEFRMESGSAGASEITVNGGSVNIDNINVMIMQDGTTITADKNVNIGDTASLGHVHTLYMSPTSTINAGGAINAYVGGDVLLGNLNSDIDGAGGEDITVETYKGQVPHPHFITNLTTGSLYTLSWGDEENGTIPTVGGTSAVNMPSQTGTVTVGGIINPNGNDVTLISAADGIVDGDGQVVNTNIFTASASKSIGAAADPITIDALVVDGTTTGTGSIYIYNTPSGDVRADFNTNGGNIIYSQQGGDLLLIDDAAWGGADGDTDAIFTNNGDATIDPPNDVTISSAVNLGTGTLVLEANGFITQNATGNITAKNAYLIADLNNDNGADGFGSNFIQSGTGAALTITASGDVDIRAAGFQLDSITAASGRIDLTANYGNIVEFGAGDAGADLAAQTINLVADGGSIGAANSLEVDATVSLDADTSQAGGNIDLTHAGAGDMLIDVVNAGAGTVNLNGGGKSLVDINGTNANVTANVLTVTNAKNIDLDTSVGSVNLTATGDVTIDETDGLNGVYISATGTGNQIVVNANGTVDLGIDNHRIEAGSGGAITVTTSSGDITSTHATGFIGATGGGPVDVTLEANGNVTLTHGIAAQGGDVDIEGLNGNVTLTALSGNNIFLLAGNNIIHTGVINATGDVAYIAGNNITIDGAVTAGGDVLADAGVLLTVATGDTVAAGTGVDFSATTADINAAVTSAAGDIIINTVGGGVDADANITADTGDVIITGDQIDLFGVSANQNLILTATQTSVAATDLLHAGTDVLINAVTSVAVEEVTATGDIEITAGTTFVNSAAMTAGVDLTVTSDGTLTTDGTVTGGTVTLKSISADLDLNNTVNSTAGDVTLLADTKVVATGAITSVGGDVNIAANLGSVSVAGVTSAANVNINAATGITINGAVNALLAEMNTQAGNITTAGTGVVTAGNLLAQAWAGSINIDTDVITMEAVARGDITVDEADGITLASVISGTGDIVVNGAQTVGGLLNAQYVEAQAGDVTLTTANSASIQAGAVNAVGNNVVLNAAGSITDGAGDVVANDLDATAVNNITLTSQVNSASLTFNAGGAAILSNMAASLQLDNTTGGTLDVTNTGAITDGGGNNVDTLSLETVDGAITYVDGDDLIVLDVRAGGTGNNVTLTAGGSMDVRYVEASDDTVSLTASGDIADSLGTGTLDVLAGTLVLNAGSTGDINLDTEVDVLHLSGANAAQNVTIREVSEVTIGANGIDTANNGAVSITAGGTINLPAGRLIDADGAGTLTLNAGDNLIIGGTLNSNNALIDLDATNDVLISGTINTGVGTTGNLQVDAGQAVTQTAGTITANSARITAVVGGVDIYQGGNDFELITVSAGGPVWIQDADDLTIGSYDKQAGVVTSNDNITITTSGSLTLNAPVTAGTADVDIDVNTGALLGSGLITADLVDAKAQTSITMNTDVNTIIADALGGNVVITEADGVFLERVTAPAGTVDITTKAVGDVVVGRIAGSTSVDLTLGGKGDVLDDGDDATWIAGTVLTIDGPSAGAVSGSVTVRTDVDSVDIEATGDVTITEANAITLTQVTGDDVEVTAGGNVTIGSRGRHRRKRPGGHRGGWKHQRRNHHGSARGPGSRRQRGRRHGHHPG